MKHYLVEPTYKKSVAEIERITNIETGELLVIETGWRWGQFMISVPETDEEIQTYLEQKGYDNLDTYLAEHRATTLEEVMLPENGDEEVNLADYDYEFLYTDDGCWTDVLFFGDNLTEEENEARREELSDVYFNEFYSGLEGRNFFTDETFYIIDCPVRVVPCNENGEELKNDVA